MKQRSRSSQLRAAAMHPAWPCCHHGYCRRRRRSAHCCCAGLAHHLLTRSVDNATPVQDEFQYSARQVLHCCVAKQQHQQSFLPATQHGLPSRGVTACGAASASLHWPAANLTCPCLLLALVVAWHAGWWLWVTAGLSLTGSCPSTVSAMHCCPCFQLVPNQLCQDQSCQHTAPACAATCWPAAPVNGCLNVPRLSALPAVPVGVDATINAYSPSLEVGVLSNLFLLCFGNLNSVQVAPWACRTASSQVSLVRAAGQLCQPPPFLLPQNVGVERLTVEFEK